MPIKAALFYDYPLSDGEVFGGGRRSRIEALTDLYPEVVTAENFERHASNLAEIEVIFGSWGIPSFSDAQLARMPKLRAVFYAAGNVRKFVQPLLDHDIILVSAWAINAIPVAEMCLSQILLSCPGYFRTVRQYREHKSLDAKAFWRPGVYGETIGLIGMGFIGTRLRGLLEDYPLEVIARDPYLTAERAQALDPTRSRATPGWSSPRS
jgi:phosphoglycerate dehydrogenase-like enzyme